MWLNINLSISEIVSGPEVFFFLILLPDIF